MNIKTLLLFFLCLAALNVLGATRTFTGPGNFSNPTYWNGGTMPAPGDNLIIIGVCTVDDEVATDNVSYGTLTIGNTLPGTIKWAVNGINRLKVTNVSSGAAGSSLNMSNGGTIIITGTWAPANLSFVPGSGTVEIQSSLSLPSTYSTYNNLVINGASNTVSLGSSCTINGNLTISSFGNFSIGAYTITVAGTCTVNGTLTITSATGTKTFGNLVIAGTFTNTTANESLTITGNLQRTGTCNIGTGTITFNGTTTQAISGISELQNLTLSNNGGLTLNSDLTVNGILILGNGKLSIGSNTLTLKGDFSGNSSKCFVANGNSVLKIAGSGSIGNLYFDQSTAGVSNRIQQLTFSRSGQTVELGNALEVTGTVTVTAGILKSDGKLTLVSTASGDARIAALPAGASVNGDVIVQKYIAAGSGRRWLHLAAPVADVHWSELKDDIFITGNGSGSFDGNSTNTPSVYTYRESVAGNCSVNGWESPANINKKIETGQAMKVFFRGDRSDNARLNNANPPAPNAAILDFKGEINSGSQAMNVTYTNSGNSNWDGWNFVANPYPSAINWDASSGWTKTNIKNTIYIWNAEAGVYATWNGVNGTNGMQNGRIAMGQGFWVQANGANPVLTMTEDVKTGNAVTGFFKNNATVLAPLHSFRIAMVQDELVRDELLFNFDVAFTKAYEKETGDALKLFNTSINLWAKSEDGQDLVINNYPEEVISDTIVLGMTAAQGGIYTLEFAIDSLPAAFSVLLIDNYRDRIIDIRKEKNWKVLINSDEASYATGRLKLVFLSGSVNMLELHATSLNNKTTELGWLSNFEINTDRYEVEHSTDDNFFTSVGNIEVADTIIFSTCFYHFTHPDPVVGANYYRVKKISTTGATFYSDVVKLVIREVQTTVIGQTDAAAFMVYPVPAEKELNIVFPAELQEDTDIELLDMAGAVVYSRHLSAGDAGVVSTHDISALRTGVYLARAHSKSFSTVRRIAKQ